MCSKQGHDIVACKLKGPNNAPKEVVQEHYHEHTNTRESDGYVQIQGQQINQSNLDLRTGKREGERVSEDERGMQLSSENEVQDNLPQMTVCGF